MSAADPVGLLSNVSLFSELSRRTWSGSRASPFARAVPGGGAGLPRGRPSDACYLVRTGDLRVTREHSDGRAIALATLGPGDIFGELAMLDGEARSASVETLSDSELLALPPADFRRLLAEHPEISREADRRAHAAAAGDERARRPPVVPDRPEPRRGRPHPADRRGGAPRGPRGSDDPDDPGRPRAARGHLARERQPVPRDARARRASSASGAAGSRWSSPAACVPTSSDAARARAAGEFARPARATWSSAQLRRRGIRDQRVLEAMAAVPRERFVPERYRAARLRRLGAADRPRADHLAALDRRRDLPGARAARARERVLEVGTGSGYSAAVLAQLAREVITIERVAELAAARPRAARASSGSRTSR